MHRTFVIAAVGVALASIASADPFALPRGFNRLAARSSNITWAPCEEDNCRECGLFEVPLDYHNPTISKTILAVARYPATKEPRLGTLFLNPGGPGGSGVDLILGGGAETIMDTAGGQYDLVSWDPRGVGLSDLKPVCFTSRTEENTFWNGSIVTSGIEARGNFTDQADLDEFYAQVPAVDKQLTEFGKKCAEHSPDVLPYVGTTATVRDLVALHDYLEGPDKPVDYWGLSYGTIIGIYFVNMFPDRVGRVVLDGVSDPFYWANAPPHEKWAVNVESTDEALTGFVTACALAGSPGCAFASKDSTADSLRDDIRQMIDLAYYYKKKYGATAQLGSAEIRGLIFQGMYSPTRWPALATQLDSIRDALVNASSQFAPTKRAFQLPSWHEETKRQSDPDASSIYDTHAITCADAVDPGNTTTQMVFDEIVKATREVSPMFGPSWNIVGFICHKWPVRAVERYTGPWDKQLSNVILVIGNEADPITPFINAKKVADALGDSAILIEQDDYGHASLAMHSNWQVISLSFETLTHGHDSTFAALNNYFLNNQLPSADQFCGTNQVLFPGQGITKSSLSALSGSTSNNLATSDSNNISAELEKARARANQLFIAAITLACGAALLLVSLIASCFLGRKKKASQDWSHITHDMFQTAHDDQGHAYNTPYDPVGNKEGGYASVKT